MGKKFKFLKDAIYSTESTLIKTTIFLPFSKDKNMEFEHGFRASFGWVKWFQIFSNQNLLWKLLFQQKKMAIYTNHHAVWKV